MDTVSHAEREREELYMESVRRYNAQHQEALAGQWLEYHQRRQRAHRRTFQLLDAHHASEIRRYELMLGINYDEGGGAA